MPDEQAASRYWATAARRPFQDVFDVLRIDFGSDLKAGVHSAPFWKTAGQGPALTSPWAIDAAQRKTHHADQPRRRCFLARGFSSRGRMSSNCSRLMPLGSSISLLCSLRNTHVNKKPSLEILNRFLKRSKFMASKMPLCAVSTRTSCSCFKS